MLVRIGAEIGRVVYESAFWIALGFAAAGLLHEFLPRGWVARRLGGESVSSALWGAVLGAPIPLCSCGVLPAAAGLRRAGASRSSLGAFLVSTPETGMDSIALSYALLGPVMACVRPVVAVVSGIIAGCVGLLFRAPLASASCAAPGASHEHAEAEPLGENVAPGDPFAIRLRRALRFGFGTLLDEIAFWLLVGLATTGLLAEFLPDHFFRDVLGWEAGLAPMLAMAVVGLPLYVCASASTPVAAALIAKGLSPGAALVFLLVGPATNAATLSVGRQILGTPRILACIASVVVGAVVAGLLLDAWAAEAVRAASRAEGPSGEWAPWIAIKVAAALVIAALLVRSVWRTRLREGRAEFAAQLSTWLAWQHSPRVRGATVAGLTALALGLAYYYGTRGGHPAASLPATRPRVVASIEPLAMLVREVGGDRVDVVTLLPPGVSPHWFEPRVSDAKRVRDAALYVEVGHAFDAWGAALLRGLDPPPRRLALLELSGIRALPAHHDHSYHPGGSRDLDPHVWLDPVRVREIIVPALAAALAEIDPDGSAGYRQRAAAFGTELEALHAELTTLMAGEPGKGTHLVALHPAWNYFATRYGLGPIDAIEVVAGEAPSPRRLARLTREARSQGAAALLIEPQTSGAAARVLARELEAPLAVVDPLGDARDPERARYAALLRWNATLLQRATGGSP